MSKSVTVISGKVWKQRSVTWNRNVASGNVSGHIEANDAAAGDCPDDASMMSEWDSIQDGRRFTRRIKMR